MLKVGERFRVKRIDMSKNYSGRKQYIGKVFTVDSICPNGTDIGEHYGVLEPDCMYVFYADEIERVGEKKMFTKSDLKTGMFGVMDNGFKFVVVNDIFVYSNGEWDKVSSFEDDLTATWKKVMKVFDRVNCFSHLDYLLDHDDPYTKLVYDRERDTKKLYNGKVVCIDLNGYCNAYTVGKIYEFKNGCMTDDSGHTFGKGKEKFYTFEDWAKFTAAKFIEVME